MSTTTFLQVRETRRISIFSIAAILTLAALIAAPSAHAESGYLNTWSNLYPGSATDNNAGCQICHGTSTQNINAYGRAVARCNGSSGSIASRIQAAEGANSDGDTGGFSNLDEINADTQPGWTAGANSVWSRNGCSPAGSNIYPGTGDVDPVNTNISPTADANGPYNGTAGQQVSFDGSGSTDPDGAITAYDWIFGDGAIGTGVNPIHAYASPGTYNVSLVVTDNDGDSSTPSNTTAIIVAVPQDPIADPNGPYNGTEGQPVAFDGSGSFDPDGGIISQYDWDFGDGFNGTGAAPSHTYAAAGNYTVSLIVVDDEGAQSAASTTTATIEPQPSNLPPISDPNGPYTGTVDHPVSFDGSASSDTDGTIVSYTWDFGDGNTGSGVSPGHTYSLAGNYTVILTVTDNEAATDEASTTAVIKDAGGVCEGLNIRLSKLVDDDELIVLGGGGENGGGDFVLTNAFDPTQVLGTGSLFRDRIFFFHVDEPAPVPCRVQVEQPATGLCAVADVNNCF